MFESIDRRRHAPATDRNREPILAVLQQHLPATGTVLEVASGTGQHAAFFTPRLAPRHWLPSDPSPEARASIVAWRTEAQGAALHDPLALDVMVPRWEETVTAWLAQRGDRTPPLCAIVCINMIHIAPWRACEGLLAGAEKLLPPGGVLMLYGPFQRQGQHTAPSNEAFDASLRSQNPQWGIRNLETVAGQAATHRLQLSAIVEMPANNLSVVFRHD